MKIEISITEFKELMELISFDFIPKDKWKCHKCDFVGWNETHLRGHEARMH